jgi:hypothetical protein
MERPAFKRVAAEHGAYDKNVTDDDEHCYPAPIFGTRQDARIAAAPPAPFSIR